MIRKMLWFGSVLMAFIAGCSLGRSSKAEAGDPTTAGTMCVALPLTELKLDYSKSVVEMAAANKFASMSKEFKGVQLRRGEEKVFVTTVAIRSEKFNELMRMMDLLQKNGYRPATLTEMLALDQAEPRLAKYTLIIYSRWKRSDGQTFFPYIYADHRGKHLSWRWSETMPQTYLLVVAKQSQLDKSLK